MTKDRGNPDSSGSHYRCEDCRDTGRLYVGYDLGEVQCPCLGGGGMPAKPKPWKRLLAWLRSI